MKEYKVLQLTNPVGEKELENKLNETSREGWNLKTIQTIGYYTFLILEKESSPSSRF